MHAWHVRRLTDLPVAGRSLVIELRVRRPVCQTTACPQRTFRQHDTIPPDEADGQPGFGAVRDEPDPWPSAE